MAAEGLSFANAFVAAPSCSASRAAMLTGQWPWRLEDGANLSGTLHARFPSSSGFLEKAGYHVGFTGKGWAPGQIEPAIGPGTLPGRRTRTSTRSSRPGATASRSVSGSAATDPHRIYEAGRGTSSGLSDRDLRCRPICPMCPRCPRRYQRLLFGVERFDRLDGELVDRLERLARSTTRWSSSRRQRLAVSARQGDVLRLGTHVPMAIRWRGIRARGRVSAAIVSLTDSAPTFLALASIGAPAEMTGQSLLPILEGAPGAEERRGHTFTAMERHMDCRSVVGQGYPMRGLRSASIFYIRNFEPSRAPAGDASVKTWTAAEIAANYYTSFGDIDPGPAKAYLITGKDDPAVKPFVDRATGGRPPRELYASRRIPISLRISPSGPRWPAWSPASTVG